MRKMDVTALAGNTYNSLYVSKASFAAISSLRSFRLGVVPSSRGGSYSLDHGDLERCVSLSPTAQRVLRSHEYTHR